MIPLRLPLIVAARLIAVTFGASVFAQSSDSLQTQVQITELGCLRTLLILEQGTLGLEDNIAQKFTELDFRVFPNALPAGARVSSEEMKSAGEKANAELIVYARATTRLKNKREDFELYEGDATVQIYSRVSGELLVTQRVRTDGRRTTDDVEAKRSAAESALDEAAMQAIKRSLAKAHKILVHEAVIVNVFSDSALLAIMEYIGKMDGIYHVKRLDFDRKTNEAHIEIIGAPHSATTWRAYLEKMPKTKVNVQVSPNAALHNKYPSWFTPPAGS